MSKHAGPNPRAGRRFVRTLRKVTSVLAALGLLIAVMQLPSSASSAVPARPATVRAPASTPAGRPGRATAQPLIGQPADQPADTACVFDNTQYSATSCRDSKVLLSIGPNPPITGVPIIFTATVGQGPLTYAPDPKPAVTGTVSFTDPLDTFTDVPGATSCAQPVPVVNGAASCTATMLNPTEHDVQAFYSGSSSYASSARTLPVFLAKEPTSTAFSIAVDGSDTVITGTVAPRDSFVQLHGYLTTTVTAPGVFQHCAAVESTAPAVGAQLTGGCRLPLVPGTSYHITVDFTGDSYSVSSSADPQDYTAPKLQASLAVSAGVVGAAAGVAVPVTVTLSDAGSMPTGPVQVYDLAAVLDDNASTPPTGSAPSCTAILQPVAGVTGSYTGNCSLVPTPGASYLYGYLAEDGQHSAVRSAPSAPYSTTAGTLQLAVHAAVGGAEVSTASADDTVHLSATAAFAGQPTLPVPDAQLSFYQLQDGQPSVLLCAGSLTAGCDYAGFAPGPHTLQAVYPAVAGVANETASTAAALTITAVPATLALTVRQQPAGSTGVPVTLDARLTSAVLDPAAGTVAFYLSSTSTNPICTVHPTAAAGPAGADAQCGLTPPPGSHNSYLATFTSRATGTVSSPAAGYDAPAATTSTVLAVDDSPQPYGVGLSFTATVTASPAITPDGTLSILIDGLPACAGLRPVAGTSPGTATASCARTDLGAGQHTATATYTGGASTAGSSSGPATGSVTAAVTSTTITGALVSADGIAVTVAVSSADSQVTGPVSIGIDGVPGDDGQCQALPLSNGTLTCTLGLPATAGDYQLHADYAGSANFTGSQASSQVTIQDSNEPCSAGLANVWTRAASSQQLVFDAGSLGSLTLNVDSTAGTGCNAASSLQIRSGGGQLFASLTAADVTGSISEAGICLTGGTFSLPAGWRLPGISLSAPICLALAADGGVGVLDGGQLTAHSDGLPFVTVPGAGPMTVQLTLGQTADGVRTLTLAGSGSTGAVTATVQATVGTDGSVADGAIGLAGISILGQQVDFAGSFSRTAAGELAVDATSSIPGPVSVLPGLSLTGVELGIGSSGFSLTGNAEFGAAPAQTEASVQGSISSLDAFSLAVTSTGSAWSPVAGLSLHPVLAGTVSRDGDGYHYDVRAAGTEQDPLASWSPVGGLDLSVASLELSSEGAACGSGPATDPVLQLSGGLLAGQLAATLGGCIDLASRGLQLTAHADQATINANLSVTGLDADLTSGAGGITLTGTGTGQLSAAGRSLALPVSIQLADGALVIGAGIDLTGFGLPVHSGYLAYASAPVDAFDTGIADLPGGQLLKLTSGLTFFGELDVPDSVRNTLTQAGFLLPAGAGLHLTGAVSSSAIRFSAELVAPPGVPFLTLPGGSTLDSASLDYTGGELRLAVTGSLTVPGSAPAAVNLAMAIDSDGTFSGTAGITGLVVLGQQASLTGSISISDGVKDYQLLASIPGPVSVAGNAVTLSGIEVSLDPAGLSLSGSASISGSAALSVTGAISSLASYSVTLSGSTGSWSPTGGVRFSAQLAGTLSRDASGVHVQLTAAGSSGPLFSLSGNGVQVSVRSVRVGNVQAPAGCPVPAGHLWLAVSGGVAIDSLGPALGSVTGAGCFDLSGNGFSFAASAAGFTLNAAGATVSELTLTLARSATSGFSANVRARFSVPMPAGGTFSAIAQLGFAADGFVIGVKADLSAYLGKATGTGYLFYSTSDVPAFDTGDDTFGSVHLVAGLSVALSVALPAGSVPTLRKAGLDLPDGARLIATGSVQPGALALTLSIEVSLGKTGQQLFSTRSGASLALTSAGLQLTVSPTIFSFGIKASTLLTLPAPIPGGNASKVALTGRILITDDAFTASLTAGSWPDALGIPGLDLDQLTIQGGIDFEGIPSAGLSASVSHLPDALASAIGYQNGAPITIAVNLSADQFLVDLAIGSQDSGQTAIAPLSAFGEGSLIQVSYAQLYLSPDGAQLGDTVYPPGFSLALQATLAGVPVDMLAKVDPEAPSFEFHGSIGQVQFGNLVLGPVSLAIEAGLSHGGVKVEFDGSLALGPATVQAGPALKFSGSLTGDAHFKLSPTGLAASLDFNASVTGSAYEAQQTCWQYGFLPYPCDYQWVAGAPLAIHASNVGFAVDSSGLTVKIPNTVSQLTFPFSSAAATESVPGSEAVAEAHAVTLATRTGSAAIAGPVSLAGSAALAGPVRAAGSPSPSGPPAPGSLPGAAGWLPAGSLQSPRAAAASATLTDGRVLVAGGADGDRALASAELYDPATNRWTAAAPMHAARVGASAIRMRDGRIMVAGGADSAGPLASSEIYDPAGNSWTAVGNLATGRQFGSLTMLARGQLLIAGGRGPGAGNTALASAELFDPATGRWSGTGSLAGARMLAVSASLPDGSVLVAGGYGPTGVLATAERYQPASGRWLSAGRMPDPRMMASASLLNSGQLLVVGYSPRADLYDPATGGWTAAGMQSDARTMLASQLLPGGRVLVAGGQSAGQGSARAELYDPATRNFTMAGELPAARFAAVSAALPDGSVLLAGGSASQGHSLATADRYRLAGAARPASAAKAAGAPVSTGGSRSALWPVLAVLALLGLLLAFAAVLRRRQPR